jgi:predicted TPR repeat methyltransferase
MLDAAAPGRRFATAYDLGCGTGLLAPRLRDRVARLDGVDLAPAMIAKARAGGLYDGLEVGEVVAALDTRPAASLDLVTAGDVFCYLGDLHAVIAATARVLTPGGLFVFTAEAVGDDEAGGDVVLRDSLRWAHRRQHLETAATAAGLGVATIDAATLRRDRGRAIAGHVALLTKT